MDILTTYKMYKIRFYYYYISNFRNIFFQTCCKKYIKRVQYLEYLLLVLTRLRERERERVYFSK